MKDIAVLHYPSVRSPNWELLCKAARSRGIRLLTWEPHRLQIHCVDSAISGCYDGNPVVPEIILHRTVANFQGIVIPLLKLWAEDGAVVLNEPGAAYRSRDKLLTYLSLCRAQVPIVPSIALVEPSAKAMIDFPDYQEIILKPAHGLQGQGIRWFGSPAELLAAWEGIFGPDLSLPRPREHYLVQPIISGGGRDLRAFVVDHTCVALMQRQAVPGEIRANLALGATATRISLDHPAASTAVEGLAACQLDYGGVDLIEDDDGTIRVLEVDAWAGFAGISAVTGEDVAGAILQLAMTR